MRPPAGIIPIWHVPGTPPRRERMKLRSSLSLRGEARRFRILSVNTRQQSPERKRYIKGLSPGSTRRPV